MAWKKMSQAEKDFKKSKNGLLAVLDNLKWKSVGEEGRGKVISILKSAADEIQPLIQDTFFTDIQNVGPAKRKKIEAFLNGKAKIQMS